jgi:hypothetical protein
MLSRNGFLTGFATTLAERAKSLGLTVPQSLLLRADEVIQ